MDALSNPSAPPASLPAYTTQGTRQRIITSCLTCRRRKVKCDHRYPVCSACSRGSHICYYANIPAHGPARSPPSASSATRVTKQHAAAKGQSSHAEINARLERLESLLERAVQHPPSVPSAPQHPVARRETAPADSGDGKERAASSQSPKSSASGEILAADAYDGTLLVENGQSHFVSSLHWALLTDELQDIKAILSNESKAHHGEDASSFFGGIQTSRSLLFSSGQGGGDPSVFMPDTCEECYELLGTFVQNVDPVSRLVHKPTLSKRFGYFIRRWQNMTPSSASGPTNESLEEAWAEEQLHNFEPLAFAIFYSAINSLRAEAVMARFKRDKRYLLKKYQHGLELSLQEADFLATSSIEVLQAFVLLLTVQAREDDMGQVWPLTGVAIRIAMLQGLHREPGLFPTSSMDEVQVEIRRRVWHQICHMDWRAAEGKGMEPTISDDDFTTLLPRNVNDTDLLENRLPPANPHVEEEGFTDMTLQLCRLGMIKCFRKIAQNVYRLDRKCKASRLRDAEPMNLNRELQTLFEETKRMVDEVHDKNDRCYLRYCRLDVTIQRLTIGLSANLEWRCWLIFWSGVPRELRKEVIADEVRTMIFTRSVSLIESLNTISSDKDAEHFQWHIGGHAAFQSIMHVLSELRDPEFAGANDPSIRSRALRALHTVYAVKGRAESNTWAVIRRMIDRLDPNHESAKMSGMGGFSEKRFGEHDLSVIFFAKSPSPASPNAPPTIPSLPAQSQPQQPSQTRSQPQPELQPTAPVTTGGQQDDYVLFQTPPVMVSGMSVAGNIEGRYQSSGPGMSAGLMDIERATMGVGDASTNAWLQDMAMDMDWGFWNFDPLQFDDGGFGQYAGPGGHGQ